MGLIHIIDYGAGNIGSIVNMVRKAGGRSIVTSNKDEIMTAEKLILPGVGHFDYGMKKLKESDLINTLREKVLIQKCPILGICLGAQLMTNGSEEGTEPGLGWIDASVLRFDADLGVKIPHMGWNYIRTAKETNLSKDFEQYTRFYFVHSYYMKAKDKEDILFETVYGNKFVSALNRDNMYAVQFHPEKSHKYGLKLMQNFINLI